MPDKLESRRQEALALVTTCTELLKRRYGAGRVIPFGSALQEGAWHERSDLDLAVEGLSSEALWQAQKELEAMVPPWLQVDLVPLERAFPEVRSRILGERTMPEDPYLALQARLGDELSGLERIVRGLEQALDRAGEAPDEFATRALASYVDDFYKGCERIAVALDGGLPQGERWHQVLLGQMGEPGGKGRPPLFRGSLLLDLDEYRRFRHRVRHILRHIYGYELEADRVLTLARGAKSMLEHVKTSVATFTQWLEAQAERSEADGG